LRSVAAVTAGSVVLLLAVACGTDPDPTGNPTPAPVPSPTVADPPSGAQPSSPPPPSSQAPPPAQQLPPLDVTGGGPFPDDSGAAARIKSLLPTAAEGYYQLEDSEALGYASKVVQYLPALGKAFTIFSDVSNCAISNGVIAVRAFLAKDLSSLSAMLMVSSSQFSRSAEIAAKCFVNQVLGGGPSQWNPCASAYHFSAAPQGVQDTYYVFAAATNGSCAELMAFHDQYGPVQDF
jgi:hypothetical protein